MTAARTAAYWAAPTANGPVHARVDLPGSKSLTNRALILAAIADGPSVVRRALRSRDTELMAAALTALGATVESGGEDWTVIPGALRRDAVIDCGLAGTVMRFVPPVAALCAGTVAFDGDAHARTRPMGEVLTALRGLGATIEDGGRGALPFVVRGRGSMPGGQAVLDASASSQFISALLLAGARYDQGVDVVHDGTSRLGSMTAPPSLPHLDMTVACLRDHGVEVDDAEPNRWRVLPGTVRATDVTIEPDLSNAAPFLMLALVTGGRITVAGWPRVTTQAGDALRDLLDRMGGEVTLDDDGLTVAGSGEVHGIDVDLHDLGELTPALAALCALADGPCHLRGIGHIRGHETDRLAALATELGALGADVVEHPDGLEIRPVPLHGGRFQTYGDHRMAHAAVLLGAVVPGVLVEDVETTAKTFPGFATVWSDLFENGRAG